MDLTKIFEDRSSFPFKDMIVDEIKEFNGAHDELKKTQAYAHVYARSTKSKKFKTRMHEGSLFVMRVK